MLCCRRQFRPSHPPTDPLYGSLRNIMTRKPFDFVAFVVVVLIVIVVSVGVVVSVVIALVVVVVVVAVTDSL